MKKIFLGFLLVLGSISYGQSVTGTSGLIHIPSARMLADGQLVFGAAYIPKPYFQRYGRRVNPGLNTYITYGILPFIEVMFRYTHELNVPVNTQTLYFPDRMLTFRAKIISEQKFIPALVVGFQDISSILGNTCFDCSNYSATYLTFSKKLFFVNGFFDLSLGFEVDLFDLKYKDYNGFFGGVSYESIYLENVLIIFEHDSNSYNLGVKFEILKKINLMFGSWDFQKPFLSFSFQF